MRPKNDYLKPLAERIRRLRENAGLSQDAFATLVKINRTHYGRIERAEADIRVSCLYKIADGLGISGSELLVGVDVKKT